MSLAKTAICVISEHGKIVKETQVASEPEALVRWVREHEGTVAAIGLEAGPLSQWLHLGLTDGLCCKDFIDASFCGPLLSEVLWYE